MATIGAKAIRRANAVSRLEAVAKRLGKRLGVDVSEASRYKDTDLQQSADIEATADFLERVDVALKDKGFSAAPRHEGESPLDEPEGEESASADSEPTEAQDAPDEAPVIEGGVAGTKAFVVPEPKPKRAQAR